MNNEVLKPVARERCVDEVIAAYLAAVQAGASPDRNAWLGRYPEFASDLASFFADQDHFDRLSAPLRNVVGTGAPTQWVDVPSPLAQNGCEGSSVAPDDTAVIVPSSSPGARRFGQYELLEEIGRGGMGVVYKARQLRPSRIVALKMILAGQLASPADVARFQSESEAAASLDHPHIVPIYEVGQWQPSESSRPVHYFSMKLVAGESLAHTLARSASEGIGLKSATNPKADGSETSTANPKSKFQNLKSLVRLLSSVAHAVHFAHQRGILHRDLKPANILLDVGWDKAAQQPPAHHSPVPYITDFGLAKRVTSDGAAEFSGSIVGTASYMAPEQAAGSERLTTAADIYSLGAILYEILTGRPPFHEKTPLETILRARDEDPAPPRTLNPRADRDIETICLKCLDKDPARRYPSAAALADDLSHWLANEPILARPLTRTERFYRTCKKSPLVSFLTAAVILVALTGLIGVLGQWQVAVANEQKAVANEQKANQQRDEAQKQRDEVESLNKQLLAAQDRLQRMLYASDLNHAGLALDSGATYRVRELLDKHRPKPGERDQRGFEWFYLDRLCRPELLAIAAHKAEVYCVAYSPDGKKLASGSDDHAVKVWDAETGRELLTLSELCWRKHACLQSSRGSAGLPIRKYRENSRGPSRQGIAGFQGACPLDQRSGL